MPENFFFYIGLSLLTLHEMDAIRCKEWRIFPGLSLLNDPAGYIVFIFAHVPIFYWIYWQLTHATNPQAFIHGVDVFMVIHVALHVLFLKHKNNLFTDWISWTIIAGAGICGLVDRLL